MVYPGPQSEMTIGRAVDDEPVGLLELTGIPVRDRVNQPHDLARVHSAVSDCHLGLHFAKHTGGTIQAKELIDRQRDQFGVACQHAAQVMVSGKAIEGIRQKPQRIVEAAV